MKLIHDGGLYKKSPNWKSKLAGLARYITKKETINHASRFPCWIIVMLNDGSGFDDEQAA